MSNTRSEKVRRLFAVASKGAYSGGLITSLTLALLAFYAIYRQQPPPALPEDAPLAEFSSDRAMNHLRTVARRPHPVGSSENTEVRNYILRELTNLGAQPQVQTTTSINQDFGVPVVAATVNNILARVKGTDSGTAILLVSHYDSVATACGASDDGSGVATMLETLRALQYSPPLKNDVILLFTDGGGGRPPGRQCFRRPASVG